MKSTAQKLILLSFILALITTCIVFLYIKSLKASNTKTNTATVLVAAETIPSRTLIEKKMLKEIQVPYSSVFNNYIKDSSKIIGKYSKETIYKDEGFNFDKLLDKNGNELSVKIPEKHRAISISVTGDSGVSDLLQTGDYVDIIMYVAEKKDGINVVRQDMAEIIQQNIQVLAVDKQINRETAAKDTAKNSDSEKTVTKFLVTLSIPADQLEKLVLAESIGNLKLALRPLAKDNSAEAKGTTWQDLIVNAGTGNNTAAVRQNSSENYNSYTVQRGDTLKKISESFYGDEGKYTLIKEANNIQKENLILIGEVLKIPKQ